MTISRERGDREESRPPTPRAPRSSTKVSGIETQRWGQLRTTCGHACLGIFFSQQNVKERKKDIEIQLFISKVKPTKGDWKITQKESKNWKVRTRLHAHNVRKKNLVLIFSFTRKSWDYVKRVVIFTSDLGWSQWILFIYFLLFCKVYRCRSSSYNILPTLIRSLQYIFVVVRL